MWPLMVAVLIAMTAVMAAGWAFQRARRNGGWTDVFWTFGTGGVLAVAALAAPTGLPLRHLLLAAMVLFWSLRLGGYVALRVARSPEDARYRALRAKWGDGFQRTMLGFLLLQAPVSTVLGLSVIIAADRPEPRLDGRDLAGVLILLIAVLGETIADRQMAAFKKDPNNAGKVCDRGLWSWSRHPNYFFEASLWLAYPAIGLDPAHPFSLLSFLAPVVMWAVVRYGTGVPALEAAMLDSKGDRYRRYQDAVSVLLPLPPRRGRSGAPEAGGL